MGPGIEPGDPPADPFHLQQSFGQIGTVEIGNLEFPAQGRTQGGGSFGHRSVIEVDSRNRVAGTGFRRLFLDPQHPPLVVEFENTIAFRVPDRVTEDQGALRQVRSAPQTLQQTMAEKNVVAQNQRHRLFPDEGFPDQKRLGQSSGLGLFSVRNGESDLASVSQKLSKKRQVLRGRYDENLPDAGQHQSGKGVIDHWLVVDGHQLLADDMRKRVEPRAASTRENDPSHGRPPAIRPCRVPASWRDARAFHQASLSRYQSTVFSSAWSNAWAGVQDSSR